MNNIIKIFLTDAKRITTNVVAIVVIMGLSVIPSLYAWFNILSNWDPYGEEATSQIQIAVFSEDEGQDIVGQNLNIGESVVEGLQENETIGWVFTETKEDALDGVYSGEYYAALVIPTDFTENMLGFLSGEANHGIIEYYENEKKNAIAPKITSKAQKAVVQQVNATFVSTITEKLVEISGSIEGAGENIGLLELVLSNMNAVDADLQTYITLLDSFINITNSANSLIDTTQTMLPNLDSIVDSGQSTVNTLQSALIAADGSATATSQLLVVTLSSVETTLSGLQTTVNAQMALIESGTQAADSLRDMAAVVNTLQSVMATYEDVLPEGDVTTQYSQVMTDLSTLSTDLSNIATTVDTTISDLTTLQSQIDGEITTCMNSVKALREYYETTVAPQIDTTVNDLQLSMIGASNILNSIDSNFSDIAVVLQQYEDSISDGNASLVESRDMAQEMKDSLDTYIRYIVELSTDEQYQELLELLKNDPELLGEFISSPVAMETVEVYPVETYGSSMSPFYTILAIWVGALILVALIHVKVHPIPGMQKVKHYQNYFGRYATFFLIGQLQTLIIVLGNFYFIRIQCPHKFLFWLACAMCSFTFTIMIYSLTVAFGNVGEAIAVVIMVIQVAGAGGTFPIEVLPKVYQYLYKFLPFTHGMAAMKECIAGMYGADYWKELGILLIFVVISLIIGIFVAIPCEKLNHMIEESKKRAKIMI